MMLEIAAIAGCLLASVPATNALINLLLFAPARRRKARGAPPRVSVLIPARDEEPRIAAALEAVLANPEADLDVVVMDDHSRDRTADIVRGFASRDRRWHRIPCRGSSGRSSVRAPTWSAVFPGSLPGRLSSG